MRIDVYHHNAEDITTLLHKLITSLNLTIQTLKELQTEVKKIKEISMKTQEDIDKLTADVQANTSGVKDAILAESAEIQAAIESSKIDTTALEAAVAENQKLAEAVSGIFTPEQPPVEDEPPVEEPPVEEPPVEDTDDEPSDLPPNDGGDSDKDDSDETSDGS